jgi:hypothetical protein
MASELFKLLQARFAKKDSLCDQRLALSTTDSKSKQLTAYIDDITKDITALCQALHHLDSDESTEDPEPKPEPKNILKVQTPKPQNAEEALKGITEVLIALEKEHLVDADQKTITLGNVEILFHDKYVLVVKGNESLTMPYGQDFSIEMLVEYAQEVDNS